MAHIHQENMQAQMSNPVVEVAQQIGQKQAPHNEQINALIDTTQRFISNKKNETGVDPTTLKTVTDFQGVLSAIKQLNEHKNFDESLQSLLMETGTATREVTQKGQQLRFGQEGQALKQQAVQHGQELKEQGKQFTQSIWEVLKMMVRNGDFRTHLSTLLGFFQEILSNTQKQVEGSTQQQQQPLVPQSEMQGIPDPSADDFSSSSSSSFKLSEEKKHELSFNFLSILRKFNQQPEFKQSLEQMIDILNHLKSQSNTNDSSFERATQQLKGTLQSSEHVDAAFDNSKKLLGRFTERPVETLVEKNRVFFNFVRTNERTRRWFDELVQLLDDTLRRPEQLNEFEFTQRIEKLIDEAQSVSHEPEFKRNYFSLTSELVAFVDSIRNDPDLNALHEATTRFLDNFTDVDSEGNKTFNGDLVRQLRQFIVPLMMTQLENIPIPPIEGSNEDFDYYFDNMVLHGQEIFPDMVEFHSRTDAAINVRDLSTEQARTQAEIAVSNIRFKLSDIHFKFDRKTFPKLADEGLATIRVEGDSGVSLQLKFDLFVQDGAPHIKLNNVNFDIEKLKIEIQEARHEVLLKLFAGIYQTRTKLMIKQTMEQRIREGFDKIETALNDLFSRYPPSKLKEIFGHSLTSQNS